MTPQEFQRLKAFSRAKQFAPFTNITSRRTSKSKSTATGQTHIVGSGRIVSAKVKWISWKE